MSRLATIRGDYEMPHARGHLPIGGIGVSRRSAATIDRVHAHTPGAALT